MPALKYKCPYCKDHYRTGIQLVKHLTGYETDKAKDDHTKLVKIQELVDELSTRANAIPKETHCVECNKHFANKVYLHRHRQRVHTVVPTKKEKIAEKQAIKAEKKKNRLCPFAYVKAIEFLEEMDGIKDTYKMISSQYVRGPAGDALILDKLFFDGEDPNFYPVRCISLKPVRLEFLNQHGVWVDDKEELIKIARSIIQDCYLTYGIRAIDDHLDGKHNGMYKDQDPLHWQSRNTEYLDPTYQNKMYNELARHLSSKVKRYYERRTQTQPSLIDAMNQFQPEETVPVPVPTPTLKVV